MNDTNTIIPTTSFPAAPAKPTRGWTYRVETFSTFNDGWTVLANYRGLRRSSAREVKAHVAGRVRIVREQDDTVVR